MTRVLTLALLIMATVWALQPPMPRCDEDATIVGVGSFDAGKWSAYVCGPAMDDYQEGS